MSRDSQHNTHLTCNKSRQLPREYWQKNNSSRNPSNIKSEVNPLMPNAYVRIQYSWGQHSIETPISNRQNAGIIWIMSSLLIKMYRSEVSFNSNH